jgi:AraC family transcriptional regulator of adaptative response/methylated-DNA-[protein]-cysteine methyltransferase
MTVLPDEKIMYQALINGDDSFEGLFPLSGINTDGSIITLARMATPLGPMVAGAVAEGICLLEFADPSIPETQFTRLKKAFHAQLLPGMSNHLSMLGQELDLYFQGRLREFKVPLIMAGTEFQKKVWRALQAIPYGQTRSYKQQAIMIGQPKAVRAVGRANGSNRIAIIIPCHRVIGENAQLIGYGGGLWRKRFLIDLEQRNVK